MQATSTPHAGSSLKALEKAYHAQGLKIVATIIIPIIITHYQWLK